MSAIPKRPVLRYHGGKWRAAPRIIAMMPPHRVYVEPFAGAASVLMRKPRAYAEVLNDLDDQIVALFRILRDPARAERLTELLERTPFARSEFELSYEVAEDPVEQARRLIVRSFMGFGSDGHNAAVRVGFRRTSNRSHTTPAHDWRNFPAALGAVTERLQGVVIENGDAFEVMAAHDGPEVLHYADPPYLPDVRSDKSRKGGAKYHAYRHELSEDDHVRLLDLLNGLDGMVLLSGYPHPLYDDALQGWECRTFEALADGARKRTEAVWINPRAIEVLKGPRGPLFDVAEAS